MAQLRKIHRFSAVLIISYVCIHLFNHLLALSSINTHIRVMETLRVVYRNPVVEFFLIGAVIVQSVSGLRIFWKLRKANGNWLAKLQRYSGIYLAFFMLQHASAALFSRIVSNLDTNFYWAASVVTTQPYMYYYVPYYFLGVVAFGIHLSLGLRLLLIRRRVSRPIINRTVYAIMISGVVLALLLGLVFSGMFYPINLPAAYQLP